MGKRVPALTMAAYMKRFDVPKQHITELLGKQVAGQLDKMSPAERTALSGGSEPVTPNNDMNNPECVQQATAFLFAKTAATPGMKLEVYSADGSTTTYSGPPKEENKK